MAGLFRLFRGPWQILRKWLFSGSGDDARAGYGAAVRLPWETSHPLSFASPLPWQATQSPLPLCPTCSRHGRIGFGEQIEIRQGAEIGRPSVLYATVTGEGDRIDSVEVGGSALIVAEGRFRVAPA